MIRCKDCAYMMRSTRISQADYRTEIATMECHRYAPRPDVGDQKRAASWPCVSEDQWCGESVHRSVVHPPEPGYLDKKS